MIHLARERAALDQRYRYLRGNVGTAQYRIWSLLYNAAPVTSPLNTFDHPLTAALSGGSPLVALFALSRSSAGHSVFEGSSV